MIQKTVYGLDKYVIAEYGNRQLWWESHVALGEQRGGECFICGNVLILGDWSHEEDGYLVDKFFEQSGEIAPLGQDPLLLLGL